MRVTQIDGLYKQIGKCDDCPFWSTEMELGVHCRYPLNPASEGFTMDWTKGLYEVAKDCPLRVKI